MKPMIFDLKLPHWASLLECPFCGGSAELFSDGDGVYAGCSTKQCVIKPITDTYETKRDAIRAWNRRPS
ncbi:TPA: Lar family restriction alleviation protein [Salmonella enterica subsp. houtenae serovar 43:z4,z23:-]|nr:hypothetical protein [Salmonella enterica subsp. houtenae serovar 40:z4,z24:-]EDT7186626.1 hypothetical protein [Salmonella enterica subsp. enterica]EGH3481573.1 hypothetical protein [Salmonella enterica]HCA3674610.1 Lar family restriction alleviation protein [Salmonella enterica subsp. houtenae serovar Houten]EDX6934841.1 hypothetical protein [Salmonella enterica subsp. houtenae serovar 40:z4,z24:-]